MSLITPKLTLKILLKIDGIIYSLTGQAAIAYGNGIHSKHRHIDYHSFFIKHVRDGDNVLDIGSGGGHLANDLVTKMDDVTLVGIEINSRNYQNSKKIYKHKNLRFINADATKFIPDENFDVIILSNVLEHIEGRIGFLKKILKNVKPRHILIRVPSFERDWRVPLKKELGIDYRLDKTHYIEYSKDELISELKSSGLEIISFETRWGEYYVVAKPK